MEDLTKLQDEYIYIASSGNDITRDGKARCGEKPILLSKGE
jgi:hypothetical protein